jgi:RHS repeat-associated protein
VKGEAHGAMSLPPTLRKKQRRMGHPLCGLPSEGWATRQPILLAAGVTGQNPVFSLCFDFHLGVAVNIPPCSFSASTLGDNGNVNQVVNNRDNTRTEIFAYDSLNRIASGQSNGTQWGETFTIDAWGNLTNEAGITGKTYHESLSTSAGTNNQLSGFGYDAAGNMTSNGTASYVYDAENHLIWTSGYRYVYDGDGQRAEKCLAATATTACPTSGTTNGTLYWRGLGSDALAETDLSGNVVEDYIFFNGQRVARRDASTNAIHYYFSDHLGSHGVVENATASACEQDIDYYPYGGVQHDYCAAVVQNYKFTGKERDAESGLGDFGARHYASTMGRFMQPDPFNVIHDAEDRNQFRTYLLQPQNWNHYAYTWNNPLRYVDPTGELVYVVTYTVGNEGGDDKFKKAAETRANEIKNSKTFDPKKDTVLVQGVNSFDSFKSVINTANGMEKQFGKVAEVDLFSHAGDRDGPNFNEGTNRPGGPHYSNEQNAAGLESLHINWDASGQAKFFGCYTADFAQWFANSQRVPTYGFPGYSGFSSFPNFRDYGYVFGLGSGLYMTTRDGRPPVRKDPSQPH